MKDLFIFSLDFIKNKKKKFTTTKNAPEKYSRIFNKEMPDRILSIVEEKFPDLANQFIAKGSIGEGNLAEIPHVELMHKDITTSAQRGVYIVLLFSADGETLYLTLNQGWRSIRDLTEIYGTDPKQFGFQLGKYYRQELMKIDADFDECYLNKIDLRGKGNLSKGYEVCTIASKKFDYNQYEEFEGHLLKFVRMYLSLITNQIVIDLKSGDVAEKILSNVESGEKKRVSSKNKEKKYKNEYGGSNEEHQVIKAKKGKFAEDSVMIKLENLKENRIKIVDVSDKKIGYDLEVRLLRSDLKCGLEVKNITSKTKTNFYLTQFEMYKLMKNGSRLVLYDNGNVYLSRKYENTIYIKEAISYYNEKLQLKDDFRTDNIYSVEVENIKIGFCDKKFYEDFLDFESFSDEQSLVDFLFE